jgi:IclR family transcriptional regulator, acetate operon repressor
VHLERLALILEIVGQKGEATVAEVCSHSNLPKPSAYRLVNDLVEAGLLDPVAKGRFGIGTRLKQITHPDLSDQVLLETVAPVLRQAANDHDVAFFLSRLRGKAVEIIHVETPDTGVSFLHPGLGKRPLHACSCSKAVAAFSPGVANSIASQLKAYTEHTLTDVDDLRDEFELIRRLGYSECVEELERGMCSVAAPLRPSDLAPTLAIGATGSMRVFTPTFRTSMGQELIRMSSNLADRLGMSVPNQTTESA